jgi:hypothetical protein
MVLIAALVVMRARGGLMRQALRLPDAAVAKPPGRRSQLAAWRAGPAGIAAGLPGIP